MKIKTKKRHIALYFVLQFLVVGIMVYSFVQHDYNNVFMCILTLVLFQIPTIIDKRFHIELPTLLESIIIFFIFAAEILGEIGRYYLTFPHWDAMLHTLSGFIMAAIGFAMIDILNQSPKLHLNMSPVFVAFVSFCFSMTIGVLWEFFEFGMDTFFLTDMQKDTIVPMISSVTLNSQGENVAVVINNITQTLADAQNGQTVINGGYLDIGLIDTMHDMIVNCVGAICFSVIGVLYIKGRGRLAKSFIPRMKTKAEIALEDKE